MTGAAKWLRRLEIASIVAGISLLGGAFAATVHRWDYQARQERAFPRIDAVGVPPSAASAVVSLGSDEALDPLALGRIEIPRIGVRAIVREGADEATLALAVGHVGGTAHPGEIGNTVLAGHRDTFFRALRDIRVDDRVRIVVPPLTYDYRVVSLEVVAPTETRVLDPTPDEVLTLVTCFPFHYIGHAPSRFIVRATREV
jgi:sortase A